MLSASVIIAPYAGATGKRVDIGRIFTEAKSEGRTGSARKTMPVDVRPAKVGEVIETVIAGEGTETVSPPARTGDMVVRNRCPETGNEEILVSAETFSARYDGPLGDGELAGWKTYRPRGIEMTYFILTEADGSFVFTAPWGEDMVAHPGDAIVQDPSNPEDTYRIAAKAFGCTYEILNSAGD